MLRSGILFAALAGCDLLEPRVSDVTLDAPPELDAGPVHVLRAGSPVPSISVDAELVRQIMIFDGLSDSALAGAGGVVTRSVGKAGGANVMFWNFGPLAVVDGIAASAPLYVLVDDDGAGNLTPRPDHPWLIDSLPGDARYSAIRRVVYVPVSSSYAGQLLTSIDALAEAIALGLVREPIAEGHWRNLPVVPPDTRLELGGAAPPLAATQVFARGFVVDVFPLGTAFGVQPFRNGLIPIAHESRLLSGVPAGMPPVLTTQLDAAPVFQYGIPTAPPTSAFNYTPAVMELDVRLANGIEPSTITHDNQLFVRASNGSITGYYTESVDSYAVTTIVGNKQIQFIEGAP